MKAVLDAGAFVAIERADRRVAALLRVLQQRRIPLVTTAPVVAQVWRHGGKQARLARFLSGVDVRPLAVGDDRCTGELLAKAKTLDVIDAHLTLLVANGDPVLTSDPDDLGRLLEARGIDATPIVT